MSFPATDGATAQLSRTLDEARNLARNIRRDAVGLRDRSAVNEVSARGIVLLMDGLTATNDRFKTLKGVTGIAAYAKDQYNDQAFDIAAEFRAMQDAVDSVIDWINTNIPKDSEGRWLNVEEVIAGRLVSRMLTSVQTASLRTELTALISAIG